MNDRDFALQPFVPGRPGLDLQITGKIARRGGILAINYTLRGRVAAVAIPAPADTPSRRQGLWQETCFEFFLALQDSPRYWEFNLSPAGSWNVYRFAAYRQGMIEEPAFSSLPFSVQCDSDSLRLHAEVDLTGIIALDQALEVAVTTVVKLRDGTTTYWALSHPGQRADFHRRDGFSLAL